MWQPDLTTTAGPIYLAIADAIARGEEPPKKLKEEQAKMKGMSTSKFLSSVRAPESKRTGRGCFAAMRVCYGVCPCRAAGPDTRDRPVRQQAVGAAAHLQQRQQGLVHERQGRDPGR